MSATLDANILLHASDERSPLQAQALEFLRAVAQGPELLYVFWPTAMAYIRVATHPAVFDSPLPLATAIANVGRLLALPHVQTAGESERFWERFTDVASDSDPRCNLVSDAHIVAPIIENGVRTIWTHDRDYRRFGGTRVRDPFD